MLKQKAIIWIVVAVVASLIVLWISSSSWSLFSSRSEGFADPANTFTMYYSPSCGHCVKAKPDFQAFMGSGTVPINGKTVSVRMVDPSAEPDKVIPGTQIDGYPTFVFNGDSGVSTTYEGPRTKAGYMDFLAQQIGGGLSL